MCPAFSQPMLPEGFSFEVNELIMLRNWSENNDLTMVIELDHFDGAHEYDEFISLVPYGRRHAIATLWRARQAVMITPVGGLTRKFVSMAHTLAGLRIDNGIIALRQDRISGH